MPPEFITTPEAARRAAVSRVTVFHWCNRYPELGKKVAGRWRIDPVALGRLLAGEQLPRRAEGDAARG